MTAADRPTLARLRQALAEGWCLCSSASTDWRGVKDLLDRLEAAEAVVAAVSELAVTLENDKHRVLDGESDPYRRGWRVGIEDAAERVRAALDNAQTEEGQ